MKPAGCRVVYLFATGAIVEADTPGELPAAGLWVVVEHLHGHYTGHYVVEHVAMVRHGSAWAHLDGFAAAAGAALEDWPHPWAEISWYALPTLPPVSPGERRTHAREIHLMQPVGYGLEPV